MSKTIVKIRKIRKIPLIFELGHPSVQNRKSKIENRKSKIENRKSKIENRKSKIENRKSKIENRKSGPQVQVRILKGPYIFGRKLAQKKECRKKVFLEYLYK
jgi:hypothetical protein